MARLYANENFPLPVVVALRKFGHDVITIQETGRAGASVDDVDVLATAAADGRAVLTLNRQDFLALHRASDAHAGIIVCTLDLDFGRQATRIHDAISGIPSLDKQLVRVNRPAS